MPRPRAVVTGLDRAAGFDRATADRVTAIVWAADLGRTADAPGRVARRRPNGPRTGYGGSEGVR